MPFGLRNIALGASLAVYGILLTEAAPHNDNAITAAPPMITSPPSKRQLDVSALNSADSYLLSCVQHCTDVVQVGLVSARVRINNADSFCDDFGDKPGDSKCFCGNFISNSTDVGSSVSACATSSCTNVPPDIQTFLGFPSDYMSSYIGDLSSMYCDQRMFPAAQFTGPVSAATAASPASSTSASITSVTSRSSSSLPSSTASSSTSSTSSSTSSSSTSTSSSASSSSTSSSSSRSSVSSVSSTSSASATPTRSNAALPNMVNPMGSFTGFALMAVVSVASLVGGIALL